jgi:hypothetical protein
MREVEERVEVYSVDALCECGGTMLWGSSVLASHPPQYPHTCSKCKKTENYAIRYPTTRFRRVSNVKEI